jgi:hypothetical protein
MTGRGLAGLLLFVVLIYSCRCNRQTDVEDLPPDKVTIPLLRFEKDLVNYYPVDSVAFTALANRYGTFFKIFNHRILNLRLAHDSICIRELNRFSSDPDIRHLKTKSDSVFHDFRPYHIQLNRAIHRLKALLPDFPVPSRFVTFISAFNYRILTTDSILALSLDMFLGADEEEMYGSVGFPRYLSRKFSPEYLVTDALRGWIQSELAADTIRNDLISQMIQLGKIQYLLRQVLPEVPDTILFGYTAQQYEWCRRQEANIWAYFIDRDLLFSTQTHHIARYTQEGPSTPGMPSEAPGQMGLFVGYRIVNAYAKKNSRPTAAILKMLDAHELLRQSGYRP